MNKFDRIFNIIKKFYENIKPILNYDKLEVTQKWEEYDDYEDLETEIHILLSFGNYKFDVLFKSTENGWVGGESEYRIISGDKSRGYKTKIINFDENEIEKTCCENFLNSLSVISKDSPLFQILDIDRVRKANE